MEIAVFPEEAHHRERTQLEEALSDFSFTCGAPLQDLDLTRKLADVYVREISFVGNQSKNYTTVPNILPSVSTLPHLWTQIQNRMIVRSVLIVQESLTSSRIEYLAVLHYILYFTFMYYGLFLQHFLLLSAWLLGC